MSNRALSPRSTELLQAYCRNARSLCRSERGIARYQDHLMYFLSQLGPTADEHTITVDAIVDHRVLLSQTCCGATINGSLTAISSFCRFLIQKGVLIDNPVLRVERPREEDPEIRVLDADEINRLLKALELPEGLSENARFIHLRNRRAILLMLYGGLRISEVVYLLRGSVSIANKQITLNKSKFGRRRIIPLHPCLAEELINTPWLREKWPVAGSRDNSRLKVKSLAHIFERWLPRRGVEINAHQLRRTFATQLMLNGAPLPHIQKLLGHQSLETTARYLGWNTKELEESMNKLPAQW